MELVENAALVLDNGSGMMKAGFAGDEEPVCVFPSVVGRPKKTAKEEEKHVYVAQDALNNRSKLTLKYPVENGIVGNWEDMEIIWEHCFKTLKVKPSEHACLITEPPLNPKKNREMMLQIMFEKFSSPAVYIALQAILSLYGAGRTTGLVLDSGDGVTHTIPIYEGYAFSHQVKRLNLAGRDLSQYLMSLLSDKGYNLSTTAEREMVKEIKEKLCFVSLGFDDEYKSALADERSLLKSYKLPDGREITLGKERFMCPELLFRPSLIGMEEPGIHKVVYETISDCDIDIRAAMYGNIILSGGSTMFTSLSQRLEIEVGKLMPDRKLLGSIYAPKERKFSVWIGGSILAALKAFQENWITKAEYEELGVDVVHQKCFY